MKVTIQFQECKSRITAMLYGIKCSGRALNGNGNGNNGKVYKSMQL